MVSLSFRLDFKAFDELFHQEILIFFPEAKLGLSG
jgi:hypothetical protein